MLIRPVVAILDYASWYSYAPYFYTYLVVVRNLSVRASTNMTIIIPFTAVLAQLLAGVIVKYVGRYKWIVCFGMGVKVLGMGLMYRYRTAETSLAPLVVAIVLQGVGEGMFNTLLTGMQASVPEKRECLDANTMHNH